jgi:hypothetical protein
VLDKIAEYAMLGMTNQIYEIVPGHKSDYFTLIFKKVKTPMHQYNTAISGYGKKYHVASHPHLHAVKIVTILYLSLI